MAYIKLYSDVGTSKLIPDIEILFDKYLVSTLKLNILNVLKIFKSGTVAV